jgi:hypothetical protein
MVEMMLDGHDEKISLKPIKLKFQVKAAAFIAATFALSMFFEGWRQIHQSPSIQSWLILSAGVIFTLFMLWLNGFFIYIEEMSKGTLTKRVHHYDLLAERFQSSKDSRGEAQKQKLETEREKPNGV